MVKYLLLPKKIYKQLLCKNFRLHFIAGFCGGLVGFILDRTIKSVLSRYGLLTIEFAEIIGAVLFYSAGVLFFSASLLIYCKPHRWRISSFLYIGGAISMSLSLGMLFLVVYGKYFSKG